MAGYQEFALAIEDFADLAGYGRPIDMDIKDVEKDADARLIRRNLADGHDLAVRRGDNHIARRRSPLRVAKKV